MSNQPTEYANQSIKLVDDLMEYSSNIEGQFDNKLTPALAIYALLSELVDDQQDNKFEKQLKSLPNYYHVQCLRLFNSRFQNELDLKGEDKTISLTSQSINIQDNMLKYADKFIQITTRIPSIFEVIFIYINYSLKDIEERKNITAFLNNLSLQDLIINNICDKYQEKYAVRLKNGVNIHAK